MDRAQFFDRLDHLADQGQPIPCRGRYYPLWTSDDHDDQEQAATGCWTCPALEACRTYIDGNPERAGIYAGLRPTDRGEKQ